ncbi:MAG: single-stranded DNA-binding protein [Proteobacteria bacterium]|nr:single-stranded DNA-binding protein [Pseudomonadota bacterium]
MRPRLSSIARCAGVSSALAAAFKAAITASSAPPSPNSTIRPLRAASSETRLRWRSCRKRSAPKREEVAFVDVELWGRVAEIAGEYVKKGNPLYVEGRLKQDSWEDKDSGQKRTKLKVVAENIQLLGSRQGAVKAATEERPVEAASESPRVVEQESDDIPF